jgi:RNA polymerase sigma-70 factor (ECF subfamily)
MSVGPTQAELEERRLVEAARGGDRAAFKRLYEQSKGRVYNIAFYWFGDHLLAEDILQTVFLKAYRGIGSYRSESSFSTWVFRIAVNECRNQQRRHSPEYVPLEEILGGAKEPGMDAVPDREQLERERQAIIQQALMELSPKLRAVVVLKYLEDLSYEEIAGLLGCAPGTVASRLNRGLAQLEARLRPLKRLL